MTFILIIKYNNDIGDTEIPSIFGTTITDAITYLGTTCKNYSVKNITANTYSTMSAALVELEKSWNTLTDISRRSSFILYNNCMYYPSQLSEAAFTYIAPLSNPPTGKIIYISLIYHVYGSLDITSGGVTFTDISSSAQNKALTLYLKI